MNQNFPPVNPGPFLIPVPTAQTPSARQRRLPLMQIPGGSTPPGSVSQFDMSRFVWLNGTKVFAYAAASQKIVDAPPGQGNVRNYLCIRNTSTTQTLYVDYGQDASALSGIALLPGETIAYDAEIPQDDIYVFGSGAGSVAVLYSNFTLPF